MPILVRFHALFQYNQTIFTPTLVDK